MTDRYAINHNPEAQYQPGSNNTVLLNKLGITDLEEMELREFDALIQFQVKLFDELTMDERWRFAMWNLLSFILFVMVTDVWVGC